MLFVALEWVRPTKFGYGRVFAWFCWLGLYIGMVFALAKPPTVESTALVNLWAIALVTLPIWWIVRPLIRRRKDG